MNMEMAILMCIFLMTELSGASGKTNLVIKIEHDNDGLNWVIRNCRHVEVKKVYKIDKWKCNEKFHLYLNIIIIYIKLHWFFKTISWLWKEINNDLLFKSENMFVLKMLKPLFMLIKIKTSLHQNNAAFDFQNQLVAHVYIKASNHIMMFFLLLKDLYLF